MDVFELRNRLIEAYREYATSFVQIRDQRVKAEVDKALDEGWLWPEPQLGLNPAFEIGATVDELVATGLLHPDNKNIFRANKSAVDHIGSAMSLYRHQVEAIRAAQQQHNYVLTTGTGSGKSLSYIIPAVDHVLRTGSGQGVKALVIYPMNALANSQWEELSKFLHYGPWGGHPPVTFQKYTGQESDEERQAIIKNPPDILLTNYVMLELLLTRYHDRRLVEHFSTLRFVVLDELHTYRGRQGADVAMLLRRLHNRSGADDILSVGTSATMSTEGGYEERRQKVSEVASRLFGATVRPSEVITETLVRQTPEFDGHDPAFIAKLRDRLESPSPTCVVASVADNPESQSAAFVADPLTSWIESTFGLQWQDGRLERAEPLAISGKGGGAERLAQLTGLEVPRCDDAIRQQLMAGYEFQNQAGFPIFAFRLHQFVSRGDTVFATPETTPTRHITLRRDRFAPGGRNRVLLPLAFCRECGQDYYVTQRHDHENGTIFLPRELRDREPSDDVENGFLYISDENVWPDDADEVAERLPEDWFEPGGRRLKPTYRKAVPQPLWILPGGQVSHAQSPNATKAWWLPIPFRFCLSCGVSYTGRLASDFARLGTLGTDGRSTATTIMALSAVRFLRDDSELSDQAKKLLSFTDNRQDASLQAGHFNDFVQITMLRGALWRALMNAGDAGLTHDVLAQHVLEELKLPPEEFLAEPNLRGPALKSATSTLREALEYRIYRDLERGWRLTQPNLEQVGLLKIEYPALDELVVDEELWVSTHPLLAKAPLETRRLVLRVLLDQLRRAVAIRVDALDADHQEGLARRSEQRLSGIWSLESELGSRSRTLQSSQSVVTKPQGQLKTQGERYVHITPRGGFGRYLRRSGLLTDKKLSLDETEVLIEQLFWVLTQYGLVEQTGSAESLQDKSNVPTYQLLADAMVWKAGDGSQVGVDPVRVPNASDADLPPNRFFVKLYQGLGTDLLQVEAREHTAQVSYEEREQREEAFRSGDLPVLFCSPTMELGVDISQLNVVNMRNVPPTPANYAQRSGRAGRSGQPALVFTYCTTGNSHDQHFFRRPELMVAGQVEAPRIELANEDLMRAHLYAIWLAESGLDLGRSLVDILELNEHSEIVALQELVRHHLDDPSTRARALERAQKILGTVQKELEDAPWWSAEWISDTLNQLPERFERALERWKSLYQAALSQARVQYELSISHATSRLEKNKAKRLAGEAGLQLEILRAESDRQGQSDFYSYRYFASEGFLPGYSFPRLPLSAFIWGRTRRSHDDPEFLQRPRFLAISEFGPRSLIYHEGQRYQINRVLLTADDRGDENNQMLTQQAKRCDHCGYFHPITPDSNADVCEQCGQALPMAMPNLFRLRNVTTRRMDRITSDEEERQRKGYEVISGVKFADRGGQSSVLRAVLEVNNQPVFNLAYGDAATIWRLNLGWRNRKREIPAGFMLDVEGGYWESENGAESEETDDEGPMSKRTRRVIPYVEDSRNALLITPVNPLEAEVMASLQSALKAAFQVVFQLEESELATEPLPSRDERKLLLVYESAEGGAGALKQLANSDAGPLWGRVATEALSRLHYNEHGEDITVGKSEPCEAACYDCLLSYQNQLDHSFLDRALVRDLLLDLQNTRVMADSAQQLQLDEATESGLEQEFLNYLRDGGYRLPSRAQVRIEAANTTPDFLYDDELAAIYIDGPYHDFENREARDEQINAALKELGYRVIRFSHRDDWAQRIDIYKSVFGEGNQ